MMFKNHFGETVTVVLAIVMGFVMAFAVIVIDHLNLNFSNVFQAWSMVTLVILLVSAVIPYKEWSARFTALFHLPEGCIAYHIPVIGDALFRERIIFPFVLQGLPSVRWRFTLLEARGEGCVIGDFYEFVPMVDCD